MVKKEYTNICSAGFAIQLLSCGRITNPPQQSCNPAAVHGGNYIPV